MFTPALNHCSRLQNLKIQDNDVGHYLEDLENSRNPGKMRHSKAELSPTRFSIWRLIARKSALEKTSDVLITDNLF